jgi:hypothetical protein
LTAAFFANLANRTCDTSACIYAIAIFAELSIGASYAIAGMGDTFAIAADLALRTASGWGVAIFLNLDTTAIITFIAGGTFDAVAGIYADPIAADLAFGFALIFDFFTRLATNADLIVAHLLADLSCWTLVCTESCADAFNAD